MRSCLTGVALGVIVALIVLVSCTTRSRRRVDMFSEVLQDHAYLDAIQEIRRNPKVYGNTNRFLYWFDQGVLFHYAGEYDSSLRHLEKAELVLDELYARSVVNEAAGLLTNDMIRPYRGRRYEQVLLHQYLSFNYLAKDKLDESLVESRKVQLVFDRFAEKDRGRDKYSDDGMAHYVAGLVHDALGEMDNSAISLYKSVKAYQSSSVELPDRVRDFAYQRFVETDRLADIEELGIAREGAFGSLTRTTDAGAEIVVIGYGGVGPILGETVAWGTYVVDGLLIIHYRNPHGDTVTMSLPAPPLPEEERGKVEKGKKTRSGSTFHVKFSLPELVDRKSEVVGFAAVAGDQTVPSFAATNTNKLLREDIEDNRTKTLVRTAIRVVLRTIAAQRAKAEMKTSDPLVNLLVNVGTDALAGQIEKADTRVCIFLPKTIHFMRIPVAPGEHRIAVRAHDAGGNTLDSRVWETVRVGQGQKRFLFFSALM